MGYRREVGFFQGKRNDYPQQPAGFLTAAEQARTEQVLSFNLILAAWRDEYARRFKAHAAANGSVKNFSPVPLQDPGERELLSASFKGEECPSLTTGKPVTASAPTTPEHPATLANDGEIVADHYYETVAADAFWQVDLGEVNAIGLSVSERPATIDPYDMSIATALTH